MKKIHLFLFLFALLVTACIEKLDTEEERPRIELLSPLPCDTLYYGQTFLYKLHITDNTGLGNISMDVHHNFQHHSHGDHETCAMDATKEAINPYTENWIFTLPSERLNYVFDTLLVLPEKVNDTTFYDTGDYHFHIYVTDNDGYQTFTTMDVKILY